jgi:hypothetical protein
MKPQKQKWTRRRELFGRVALVAFCACWTPAAISAEPETLVSLTVDERAGIGRKGEPVTAGVPLPRGAVRDAGSLALTDERGRPTPAQIKPVSRWWDDGSLRWVHLHFQSDVPANGRQTVKLVRGGKSAPAGAALRVADERDRITVVTGPLKFVAGKRGFNGIAEAWLDASGKRRFNEGSRIIAPHKGGLAMRAGGREYRSANGASGEVVIEEQTPLYVVIRAKGVLSSSDGAQGFSYLCRLTAYAGQARVTAQVTVTNTVGPRREDAVPLEMLAWEMPTVVKNPQVLIGGQERIHQGAVRAGESGWIYQDSSDSYELGGAFEGSGNGKTSKTLGTGWAAVRGGGRGVAAGVRWFWQLYPKAVEATGDGALRLELYPRMAKPLDIYTGVSRTHELLFDFHDGATPAAELGRVFAAFQQPLRASAPLRWYGRETKGFGDLVEADPELFGERRGVLEKYIAWWTANFDNIKQAREGRSIRGVSRDAYGWLDFGDGFHHVWQPGNSDPRNLAWDGNYYDFPHACLLHYLLTGRDDFFDFFIEHSRHLADVHFVHHDPNPILIGSNRYCPPTDHVRIDPPRGDYSKAEVYVSDTFNHHKTLSLFENYLLTGDRRSLDAALSGLKYAYEYTGADGAYNEPRGPGNQLLTLLAGYEFTGDRKYLDRCHRIIEFGKQAQTKNGGGFAPRSGQYFQVGITLEALIGFHGLTGDETVVPMVQAAIDSFIAKKLTYANCAYAAGFLYRQTGRSEYLDYALAAVTKGGVFGNPVKETGLSFRSTPYALPFLADK